MRMPALLLGAFLLAGCGAAPQAGASASRTAVASPSASPSSSPSASPSASGSPPAGVQAHCTGAIPTADPLALISLTGSQTPTLADVSDAAHPAALCTITGPADALRLVSPAEISYATAGTGSAGSIATIDPSSNTGGTVASWTAGAFASGAYAFSPDGSTLAYLASSAAGVELHLVAREDDRTITTLPPVPGRGISPDDDSLMIAFSPDGAYLALVETFTGSGTGAQASFQVRRLDGSLVAGGPAGRTMATWAGRGSVLYFRDRAGVERWTAPSTVSAVLAGVVWIHPRPSPDGRWIAFTQRGDLGLPSVRLLDLTSGAVRQLATGASEPVFLNSSTVWYRQERLCGPSDDCGMGGPSITTGAAFVYDLSSGRSSQSTIAGVLDTFTPAR